MSKGLEALEYLRFCKIVNGIDCEGNIMLDYLFRVKEEKFNIIEKELKALEIIKKKNVNIGLVNVLGSVEQYNQTYVYDNMLNVKWCLTQEEYELLKEVLKDEY